MSLFKNYPQLKLSTIFLAQSFNILFFYVQVFSIFFFLQKFENKLFFQKNSSPPPRNQMVRPLVNPLSGVALFCFPYFTPSSKKGAKFELSTGYIANFDANFRKS